MTANNDRPGGAGTRPTPAPGARAPPGGDRGAGRRPAGGGLQLKQFVDRGIIEHHLRLSRVGDGRGRDHGRLPGRLGHPGHRRRAHGHHDQVWHDPRRRHVALPRPVPESVNAVKAWASIVNASGGLPGARSWSTSATPGSTPTPPPTVSSRPARTTSRSSAPPPTRSEDISAYSTDAHWRRAGRIGIPDLAAFAFLPLACDPETAPSIGGYGRATARPPRRTRRPTRPQRR